MSNTPVPNLGNYATRRYADGLFSAVPIANVTGLTAALAAKAPLSSPALTGTPTAPTAAAGTNTTQLATCAFVTGAASTLSTAVGNKADKVAADLGNWLIADGAGGFQDSFLPFDSVALIGSDADFNNLAAAAMNVSGAFTAGGNAWVGGNSTVAGSITVGTKVVGYLPTDTTATNQNTFLQIPTGDGYGDYSEYISRTPISGNNGLTLCGNIVVGGGYNLNASGAVLDPSKPSSRWGHERSYGDGRGATFGQTEIHLACVTPPSTGPLAVPVYGGIEFRGGSAYLPWDMVNWTWNWLAHLVTLNTPDGTRILAIMAPGQSYDGVTIAAAGSGGRPSVVVRNGAEILFTAGNQTIVRGPSGTVILGLDGGSNLLLGDAAKNNTARGAWSFSGGITAGAGVAATNDVFPARFQFRGPGLTDGTVTDWYVVPFNATVTDYYAEADASCTVDFEWATYATGSGPAGTSMTGGSNVSLAAGLSRNTSPTLSKSSFVATNMVRAKLVTVGSAKSVKLRLGLGRTL